MIELTIINRPPPPQTQPTSISVSNDELNYPHFRLLNRQSRVVLSPTPFELQSQNPRCLFAVANSRGWFSSIIKSDDTFALICSPLSDLRTAATNGDESTFKPSRSIALGTNVPCILSFAANDTRLLLGLTSGEIFLYDTSSLFTSEQGSAQHLHVFQQATGSIIRQFVANPNNADSHLASLVAVLLQDGRVLILNIQSLTPEGGWMTNDDSFKPAAVAWSPKGKQLAIGLQSGDILTFTLTDKSKFQKYIPSTAPSPLVSLSWLAPGHTFQTTYGSDDPQHHIVSLDTNTSSVHYTVLGHPFPLPDRPQHGFTVFLPNWDLSSVDGGQTDGSRSLVLFGDVCSTDIEVMGNLGAKWDQKSRDDSSIAIPLDKNYDDTFLLALAVDLTSTTPAPSVLVSGESTEWPPAPVLYAYLNDGTVQAWYIAQATPYIGMVVPSPIPSVSHSPALDIVSTGNMEQDVLTPATDSTNQVADSATTQFPSTSQHASSFDQSLPPAQLQPSSIPRPSVESLSAATNQNVPSISLTGSPSPFGQQSTFGQTSAFGHLGGQNNSSQSVFGQGSFGQSVTTSVFGQGLGQSTSSTSAFGSMPSAGGFTSFASSSTPKFGQSAFNFGGQSTSRISASQPPSEDSGENVDMQAEISMQEGIKSESSLSFGGLGELSLGSSSSSGEDSKPAFNSMFGSVVGTPSQGASTNKPTGGMIKPATGFGAFTDFGQGQVSSPKREVVTGRSEAPSSLFGSSSKLPTGSTFGQPSFGQPSFGQSSFGQSSFGRPGFVSTPTFGASSFGKPAISTSATNPSSGGFAVFAQSDVAFGKTYAPSSNVFGQVENKNFGTPTKDNMFTGKPTMSETQPNDKIQPKLASPLNGTAEHSDIFGGSPISSNTFTKESTVSAFTKLPETSSTTTPLSASSSPDSNNAAPFPPLRGGGDSPSATSTDTQPVSSPFPLQKQSSPVVKPASGFGAFGNNSTPTSSPFFKTEKTTPALSFGSPSLASSSTPKFGTPAFTVSTSGSSVSPKFGMATTLGTQQPIFVSPSKGSPVPAGLPNTGSAFASFSKGSSAFSAFAGPQKSFKDLLSGSSDGGDPEKPKATGMNSASSTSSDLKEQISVQPASPGSVASANNSAPQEVSDSPKIFQSISSARKDDDHRKIPIPDGKPLSSVSLSSGASSFVEVTVPSSDEGETGEEQDAMGGDADDDEDSFVSEPFSSDEASSHGQSEEDEEEKDEKPIASTDVIASNLGIRSPSVTPTADIPSVRVSKSPTPTPDRCTIADTGASTTPPGSPEKQPSDALLQPSTLAPPPVPITPPLPGLAANRPNTRPARSSPLAKTPPLSSEPDQLLDTHENGEPNPAAASIQFKPKLASPKGTFGVLPIPKVEEKDVKEDDGVKVSRSKTPPLLSSSKAPLVPQLSPNGPSVPPNTSSPAFFPSTPPPFSQSKGLPNASASPSPIFAGLPPLTASSPSFFSPPVQATPKPPTTSTFGGRAVPTILSNQESPKLVPRPKEPSLEEGMQAECAYLFSTLAKELEDLRVLAQDANKKREEFGKPTGGHHLKSDLVLPDKWGGLDDAVQLGTTMRALEWDIKRLKQIVTEEHQTVLDLQGSMLKAGTRREEIARFNQAKSDADFSQMLKSRTLGPEHHETQVQLRKAIRDIRDRVVKLEEYLEASKLKLSRMNKGKPVFKAPSLVTAHRTFKNIDIAIQQEATEIASLSSRLAKLDISNLGSLATLDSGVSSAGARRPFNITPNVAVTTAAALNAERSTQRLKNRLLSTRREPLLNNKTVSASKVPVAFSTPRQAAPSQTPPPDFSSPSTDQFSPSPSFSPTPSTRRGAAFSSKHYKSVPLKKAFPSPEQASPPAAPAFDWGPLPTFPPLKTLATPIIPAKSSDPS